VNGIVEIQPWILSWGEGVEVLEPPELRDAFRAAGERLLTIAASGTAPVHRWERGPDDR